MEDYALEDFIKIIQEFNDKNVIINQFGFINSMFYIQKMVFTIKNDILYIKDEKSDIYININLNQVYKKETALDSILLYLDNDTQIKISV